MLFRLPDERRGTGAEYPNVMPDGKGIVFRQRLDGQTPDQWEIMEMAVPGGVPHPLVRGVYARYAASGHLVVVTADGKLLGIPFDAKKRVLTGPPVALMDGLLPAGPYAMNIRPVPPSRWAARRP